MNIRRQLNTVVVLTVTAVLLVGSAQDFAEAAKKPGRQISSAAARKKIAHEREMVARKKRYIEYQKRLRALQIKAAVAAKQRQKKRTQQQGLIALQARPLQSQAPKPDLPSMAELRSHLLNSPTHALPTTGSSASSSAATNRRTLRNPSWNRTARNPNWNRSGRNPNTIRRPHVQTPTLPLPPPRNPTSHTNRRHPPSWQFGIPAQNSRPPLALGTQQPAPNYSHYLPIPSRPRPAIWPVRPNRIPVLRAPLAPPTPVGPSIVASSRVPVNVKPDLPTLAEIRRNSIVPNASQPGPPSPEYPEPDFRPGNDSALPQNNPILVHMAPPMEEPAEDKPDNLLDNLRGDLPSGDLDANSDMDGEEKSSPEGVVVLAESQDEDEGSSSPEGVVFLVDSQNDDDEDEGKSPPEGVVFLAESQDADDEDQAELTAVLNTANGTIRTDGDRRWNDIEIGDRIVVHDNSSNGTITLTQDDEKQLQDPSISYHVHRIGEVSPPVNQVYTTEPTVEIRRPEPTLPTVVPGIIFPDPPARDEYTGWDVDIPRPTGQTGTTSSGGGGTPGSGFSTPGSRGTTDPGNEDVGVTRAGLHEDGPIHSTLTWHGTGPDARLLFYLGSIGCSDVTLAGLEEWGDDDFNFRYAVVVLYDDGTSRSWGGSLYNHWEVGEGWNEPRSRIDRPMVSVNLFPSNSGEVPIEARVPGKRITSIHISTAMFEDDTSGAYISTRNPPENYGGINEILAARTWSEEEFASNPSVLSRYLWHEVTSSGDDFIGINDHHFSRESLEALFVYAERVENKFQVERIVSDPTTLGYEDSGFPPTVETHGLGQYYSNWNVPSSFGGRGTGDDSEYDYYIHCLVGPQEAFSDYIAPLTDLNRDEPFVDLERFNDPSQWDPSVTPWWREGTRH